MGSRINQKPQGFAVVDTRWNPDNLRDNDAVLGNSDYGEASPLPGQMVVDNVNSLGQLEVSGGQSTTVYARAGFGGAADYLGGRIVYRLEGETDDFDWRGWNPPNWPVWWEALVTTKTGAIGIDVIPSTQEPVILRGDKVYRWNNSTEVFDSATLATVPSPAAGIVGGICVIPGKERILAIRITHLSGGGGSEKYIRVHFSDDSGATWAEYSLTKLDSLDIAGTVDITSADVAYNDGQLLVMVCDDAAQNYQWASSDQGGTFDFVGSSGLIGAGGVSRCAALPDGGFIVTTHANSSASYTPRARIIGTAYDSWADADVLDPFAAHSGANAENQAVCVWPDPDGTLWGLTRTNTGGTGAVYSVDNGQNWTKLNEGLADLGSAADDIERFKVVACKGGAVMVHEWDANVNATALGTAVWFIGGWSKVETDAFNTDNHEDHPIARRTAFGESSTTWAHTWLPIELPDNMGTTWTQVGATAGTIVASTDSGGGEVEMQLQTSSSVGSYQLLSLGAPSGDAGIRIMAQFQMISGGSLTTTDMGFGYRLADGTYDYRVRVNATTTGFAVRDVNAGSQLASATVDMTANSVCILLTIQESGGTATAQCFYRLPGLDTQWIEVIQTQTLTSNGTPAATPTVFFGALNSASAEALWHQVHTSYDDGGIGREPLATNLAAAPFTGLKLVTGRWLTASPVPIPEAGTVTQAAGLALKRGPVGYNEIMTIAPDHQYPVDAVFPTISPSPTETWRSLNDTDNQRIALDFTRDSSLDGAWVYALALINTNLASVTVDGWDGAAWQTLGTYNGDVNFTGISYDLTGDMVRPAAATSDAGRYLHANEAKGGYIVLDPSGTPKVRKILHHTGGSWTGSGTTTTKPKFRLEGIDGTELATGTCNIIWPSGCLVMYLDGAVADHYERFSIAIAAASNDTADGYFYIGSAAFGAVTIPGQQSGRGWSRARIPNVSSIKDAHGTIRKTQEGPSARRWVWSWQSGQNMENIRQTLDLDYLSATSAANHPPLVASQDVWWQLESLLIDAKGGEVPVLALARLPSSEGTITGPDGFLYGMLSGTVQANNVVGDELTAEAMRVESLTVDELV